VVHVIMKLDMKAFNILERRYDLHKTVNVVFVTFYICPYLLQVVILRNISCQGHDLTHRRIIEPAEHQKSGNTP
jgi:hypothetical protein